MLFKIKQIVKSSPIIYFIYYHIGSLALRVLGLFVKTDENLVLFVVYGGQRYDDSPRFVYEYMKKHKKYQKYKLVWAFMEPESINVDLDYKIKIDSLEYYITALQAKYWITNSSASRGLNFRKKNTINILFPHGMTGIKVVGKDIHVGNKSFGNKFKEDFDCIFIEGKKEKEILVRAWEADEMKFLSIGLPRNDELVNKSVDEIIKLKLQIGIPLDKKVILYAPTYREYNKDIMGTVYLKSPFDYDIWYRNLGNEYVLILTAHYEVAKYMNIPDNREFIVNAFKYPYINDLMLVSDILISDYSSIIFDFAILGRPIISYAYDFEIFCKERGVYDGYESIFSHGIMRNQEDVINYIKTMDYDVECEYTRKKIRDEYISNYGDATEKAVTSIFGE